MRLSIPIRKEEHTIKAGRNLNEMTLNEMDELWNEAKSKGL